MVSLKIMARGKEMYNGGFPDVYLAVRFIIDWSITKPQLYTYTLKTIRLKAYRF